MRNRLVRRPAVVAFVFTATLALPTVVDVTAVQSSLWALCHSGYEADVILANYDYIQCMDHAMGNQHAIKACSDDRAEALRDARTLLYECMGWW